MLGVSRVAAGMPRNPHAGCVRYRDAAGTDCGTASQRLALREEATCQGTFLESGAEAPHSKGGEAPGADSTRYAVVGWRFTEPPYKE